MVRLGIARGDVVMSAKISDTAKQGVVIAEGVWPDDNFEQGIGINLLIDATPVPPAGGVTSSARVAWCRLLVGLVPEEIERNPQTSSGARPALRATTDG